MGGLPGVDGGSIRVSIGDASAESGAGGTSGVTNSAMFLAAGYVVVDPGCRGHDNVTDAGVYYGKAPAAVVDLKAAIRYLRHNAGVIPGNTSRIWASGGSAGAALSTVLGASGNSPLYSSALSAIGAANADDSVFGVAAYSPMANMENEDVLYEQEFGTASYQGSQVNQTISGALKNGFAAYQDGLALTGDNGYGTLTAANLTDYVMKAYLIPAASAYIGALSSSDRATYLLGRTWITWDSSTSTASFAFTDYVNSTGRGKGVPAFDSLFDSTAYAGTNTSLTPEVEELGSATTDARHFTPFSLQMTTGDAAATISSEIQSLLDMMNPMHFLAQNNTTMAQYWFIRDGSAATDTSVFDIVDIATAVENAVGASHVSAAEYWEGGHAVNEDPQVFMALVNSTK
jgi:hypothetical protein